MEQDINNLVDIFGPNTAVYSSIALICAGLACLLYCFSAFSLWPYGFPPHFPVDHSGFQSDHPKRNLIRVTAPYLVAVIVFAAIFFLWYGRQWFSQFEPCQNNQGECWRIFTPLVFYGVLIIAYSYCLFGLLGLIAAMIARRSLAGLDISIILWIIPGVVFLAWFVIWPLSLWNFGIRIVPSFAFASVWIFVSVLLLIKRSTT